MKSQIAIWKYVLTTSGALSPVSGRSDFSGALVRIDGGVGCVHPWPELGDAPLDAQIGSLVSGQPTVLVERTLECIRVDGRARREGRNLFTGFVVPESHDTITGTRRVLRRGFRYAKVKIGWDLGAEAAMLRELGAERIRLDANASLGRDVFEAWWHGLPRGVQRRVQFVEDPFPFDAASWKASSESCGVDYALDRLPHGGGLPAGLPTGLRRVIKPAVEPLPGPASNVHAPVITSYMDHPLGQVFAAWTAASRAAVDPRVAGEVHGLCTHHLFESNPFSEQLRTEDARLVPPPGTGLGFDELLDALPWAKI